MNPYHIIEALLFLFFAITFIQSGLDKFLNAKGNIGWFKSQFEKTILNPIIVPCFWWIAVQEIVVGGLMVWSSILVFNAPHSSSLPIWTLAFSVFLFLQLFAGQRIAKDYVAAAGIVPYIIVALIGYIIEVYSCC